MTLFAATDAPDVTRSDSPVLAIDKWATNGHLIADCARLGYLDKGWRTLDPTYGYGAFWGVWRPDDLVACDLNPKKSPIGYPVDFTALPWPDREFRASVFDPPYKLNGTPSAGREGDIDERFGVDVGGRDWKARMRLIVAGAQEVARVTDEFLLVKCQDQVVSGKIRWQTRVIEDAVAPLRFGLKDRFEFLSYRAQPNDVTQRHAHRQSSQLLVFKRGWKWGHAEQRGPAPSVSFVELSAAGGDPTVDNELIGMMYRRWALDPDDFDALQRALTDPATSGANPEPSQRDIGPYANNGSGS